MHCVFHDWYSYTDNSDIDRCMWRALISHTRPRRVSSTKTPFPIISYFCCIYIHTLIGLCFAVFRWKARSQALVSVLGNLGAHFLCLQEVDEFQNFYKPNLDALGYSALYVQRNGKKRDGCALFYAPETSVRIYIYLSYASSGSRCLMASSFFFYFCLLLQRRVDIAREHRLQRSRGLCCWRSGSAGEWRWKWPGRSERSPRETKARLCRYHGRVQDQGLS